MPRQILDGDTFDRQRETHEAPWLAVFVSDWCQPCETLLSRLSGSAHDIVRALPLGVVDIEREPALAERYGVKGTPTLVLFVDGEPRATRVGALSDDQLRQLCEEAGRS